MSEESTHLLPKNNNPKQAAAKAPLWPMFLTGIVMLSITSILFIEARNWQNDRLALQLDQVALSKRSLFQIKIDNYFDHIDSIQRFFDGSEVVERSEFTTFVKPILDGNPAIKSLVWVPNISKNMREAFEKANWEKGLEGRAVYANPAAKASSKICDRQSFLPIMFMEPMPADGSAIGFDMSSDPSCGAVFESALSSKASIITANIDEFHGLANAYGDTSNHLFIIKPVFERYDHENGGTQAEAIRGFLLLVFDLSQSFKEIFSGTMIDDINIELIDATSFATPKIMYTHRPQGGSQEAKFLGSYLNNLLPNKILWLEIPSVKWSLEFSPTYKFYKQKYSWTPEFIYIFGLILTGGVLLMMASSRRRYEKIEKKVKARTQHIYNILEGTNVGTWDWDIVSNRLSIDERWAGIIGYTLDELQLTTINLWRETLNPDDLKIAEEALNKHFAGELDYYDVEFRQLHKDGFWVWVNARGKVVKWSTDGKPLQMSGVHIDINERRTEKEIRKKAEQRTKAILDTAVDGIITIDDSGTIESMNPAAEELFGCSEADAIGQNVNILMPEPYKAAHDGYMHNYTYTGVKKIIGIGREVVGLHKGGKEFPMDLAVSEMQLGLERKFVGVIRDISDRKRAEEEVRQSQKMDALGKLAGGVAHEFNNILVGILGFSSMAQEDIEDHKLVEISLKEITSASTRAAALTQELLTFSRKKVSKTEVLQIGDLIHDVTNFLGALISLPVQLDVVLRDEDARIKVDAGQFSQALTNLVVNARDAMAHGGQIIISSMLMDKTFLLSFRPTDQPNLKYVCLSIRDNGSGMNEETKKQIFEPFFTTKGKGEGKGKGTGLGLSMVYGFVEQSGGHIEFESQPESGTVFNLYFPISEESSSAPHEAMPSKEFKIPQGLTVLVVDDEEIVLKFASAVLAGFGLKVLTATNGQEGLNVWHEHKDNIDMVLSDIIMPELDGPEMIERIRQDRPDVKVIFMSGFPGQSEGLPENLYSSSAFIEKPFAKNSLLQVISEVGLL